MSMSDGLRRSVGGGEGSTAAGRSAHARTCAPRPGSRSPLSIDRLPLPTTRAPPTRPRLGVLLLAIRDARASPENATSDQRPPPEGFVIFTHAVDHSVARASIALDMRRARSPRQKVAGWV